MKNVCSSASTPGQADDLDHLSGSFQQDQSLFDQMDFYMDITWSVHICALIAWLIPDINAMNIYI